MIKVSVLMTVFNTERYLEDAINSILRQSYKNFEFILVDDKSTDDSTHIIKKFKNKKIKKFFLKKHIGRTPALNYGLKKCKGEYIAILDSDDISSRRRLFKQVNYLDKNLNNNIIGTKTILINSSGKKLRDFYTPHGNKNLNKKMIFDNFLPHSSVMIRKKFFKKIGLYYPKEFIYAQDYALWLKFLLHTEISILSENLTKCRVTKDNMTNLKKYDRIREFEMIKNNYFALKNFNLKIYDKFLLIFKIKKRFIKLFYRFLIFHLGV